MLTSQDREILRLAVPAFLALVAEPLFLLCDAAIVGHLGTPELAGLGIAAVILQTVIGLCVFLAYGTTASVARYLGAGDLRGALTQGIDGIWLAVVIGTIATVAGIALTEPLIGLFGAGEAISGFAADYLRIAFLGTTPLLVMLATTGVLRGLMDTRTPLYVAVAGNGVNIVLNFLLVFGLAGFPALGVAGAAIGSVIAQVACATALTWVVVRGARREGASLAPDPRGVLAAGRAGIALVVRTLSLRAALLVGTYAATLASPLTERDVATHQIAFTIWSFLAFAMDAIAIAAQALTGRSLGAGDLDGTRAITRRMVRWGIWFGVAAGALLAVLSPWLGALFTPDQSVRDLLTPVLLVAALSQPIAGVVFVLDGVLIGAGDGRYLAWTGVWVLVIYAPVVLAAAVWPGGLVAVWVAFSFVFMGARCVVLLHRGRTDAWLVTGVPG